MTNEAFVNAFAAVPINTESFANEFVRSDSMRLFPDQADHIAAIIRAGQPQTYGEFLAIMRGPDIAALSKEMSAITKFPLQDVILGTTHRIYDFLRRKDPALPRNGYRPEEMQDMHKERAEALEEELERSMEMINDAVVRILGVHPGDL